MAMKPQGEELKGEIALEYKSKNVLLTETKLQKYL